MGSFDGGVGFGPGAKVPKAYDPPKPPPPTPNIFLSFQGIGFSSGKVRGFDAVCGKNPPTPTGGYGKWNEVPRPLQDALTIYQGRTAAALAIEIIFGSWVGTGWQTTDQAGKLIEDDISTLEWMGGQGFHSGPSPVVYMWSRSSSGGPDTDLIPTDYAGMPWIISDGIQWTNAIRNPNGFRVWQEASFTVKNYLNLNTPPKPDTNVQGGYYLAKAGRDTPLLIAGAPDVNSPTVDHSILAGRICEDPKNNPIKQTTIRLNRKGVYFKIKHGVSVWIPGHLRN